MIETVIVPAAVLFFLVTWMVAEEATRERIASRVVPQPEVTPEVVSELAPAPRAFWFF